MLEPPLPTGLPRPLDRELLAWAAGFFDGEGSTIAQTDARRPGYFRLEVTVPQSGSDGVPEVLKKFQCAMLGVGSIRPQPDGVMHRWSAGGRIPAEMSLALLWPWLGSVKRAQALAALTIVEDQYARGRPRRPPRYAPSPLPHRHSGTTSDARLRFAWAAGFLDAEGYFGNPKKYVRVDGTVRYLVRASASQHGTPDQPAEVLVRLKDVLGGRIERHGEIDDHKWVMEGLMRVDWIVEELREWLGIIKLDQATRALDAADLARARGGRDRCIRGHVYDVVAGRADGSIHRRCNSCARLRDRAKRRANGGAQRCVRTAQADSTRRYQVN